MSTPVVSSDPAGRAVRLTWGAGDGADRRVHWPDPRLSGRSLCDRRLSTFEHEDATPERWERWCRKNGCRQQFELWLSQHAPSLAQEYRARGDDDDGGLTLGF
ncbi:hypothetical protein SAMN06264364_13040 [Quadrisphaera granulorum]|uniref:Uncharacterized protein n=1 Tax=Quadrisphaera granulorum TaxID=317664 RepID=A0A315ZSD5_9ACTN|nr:hypothetical protein [Quadrisphaera granulorum]PWJ48476.1 hypothetical protein BXY45_13040 [Quadrisphaera granulorum]SZE98435.1 hypothetical protein SAMN06264364_13040 [Quadrisphaera granulorum]